MKGIERKAKSLSPPKSPSLLKKDSANQEESKQEINNENNQKKLEIKFVQLDTKEKRRTLLGQGGQKVVYAESADLTTGVFEYAVSESLDQKETASEKTSDYENFLSLFSDGPFMTPRLGIDTSNEREFWVRQGGSLELIPISYKEMPSFFYALCCSVENLTEKKFSHQDLKPSNITVGNDGIPKWIDFNQVVDMRKGLRNYALTPAYAPPELTQAPANQVRNGKISRELSAQLNCLAIDVWALGAILYFLYARCTPPRNEKGEFIGFATLEARNQFVAIHPTAKQAIPVISALMSRSIHTRLRFFAEIKNHEFFKQVDKENFLIELQYGSKSKNIIELNNKLGKLSGKNERAYEKKIELYLKALDELGADVDVDPDHLSAIEREAEQAGLRAMLRSQEYNSWLVAELNSQNMAQEDRKQKQLRLEKQFWGEKKEVYKRQQQEIILDAVKEHKKKKHAVSRAQIKKSIVEAKINMALCRCFSHLPGLLQKLTINVVSNAEAVTEIPSLNEWLKGEQWKELRERNRELNSFGKSLFGRSLNIESLLRRYHLSQTRTEKTSCLTDLLILIIEYPRYKQITRYISEVAFKEDIATYFETLFSLINQFFPEEEKALNRSTIKADFEKIDQMINQQIEMLKTGSLSEDEERLNVLKKIRNMWGKEVLNYKIINVSLEELRQKVIRQKEALQVDNHLQDPRIQSSLKIAVPKTMSASCENLPEIQNLDFNTLNTNPSFSSTNSRKLQRRESSKAIVDPKDKIVSNLIPLLERWQEKTGGAERAKDMARFDRLIVKYYTDIEDKESKRCLRLQVLCEILAISWQWLLDQEGHSFFAEVKELLFRAITTFRRQARLLLRDNPDADLLEFLKPDLVDQTAKLNELEEIDFTTLPKDDDFMSDDKKKRKTVCCGFFSREKEETVLPQAPSALADGLVLG